MNSTSDNVVWSLRCPADHRGWLSAFSLQGIFICLGNTVTVVVFWRRRSALRKASYLLINLAITDLFVGVGVMLLAVVDFCRKMPTVAVLVVRCSVFLGATASIWSLAAIAVERAFAISKPLRHRTVSTRCYYGAISAAWTGGVVSTVCAVFFLLGLDYFQFISGSILGVCLITIIVSYCIVWRSLAIRMVSLESDLNRAMTYHAQNARAAKTLSVVTFLSLAAWLPFQLNAFFGADNPSVARVYVFSFVKFTNSLLNPFVYALRMPFFRDEIRRICRLKCCQDRHGREDAVVGRMPNQRTRSFSVGEEGSYKLRQLSQRTVRE